ncbi:hypothetical protein ACI8AF_07840 [Blastococcus sp. SYSU D00669]
MDVEQLLRSNFADRAGRVDGPPPDLHATVVAGARRRHRRVVAGGVALAVAVAVAVSVPLLRGPSGGTATPEAAAPTAAGSLGATRGSLAGDLALLEEIRRLSWDTGMPSDPGAPVDPPLPSRRVLFAGEVPDGQVWALVQGTFRDRPYVAWFGDPEPSDGLEFTLLDGPDVLRPDTAVALLDRAGNAGPLVAVARDGDELRVGVVPPGTPDDEPVTSWELPTQDGVGMARIDRQGGDGLLRLEVHRDGALAHAVPVDEFDSSTLEEQDLDGD